MLREVLLAEPISSGYCLLFNKPFAQREIASISVTVGFVSESATFFEDLVERESNVVLDEAKIYEGNTLPLS